MYPEKYDIHDSLFSHASAIHIRVSAGHDLSVVDNLTAFSE